MVDLNTTTAATLSRRAFLTTAPAVALAAAPAVALARPDASDEPILALWRRWDALCEQRLALEIECRRINRSRPEKFKGWPVVAVQGHRYGTLAEIDRDAVEAQKALDSLAADRVERVAYRYMLRDLKAGRRLLEQEINKFIAWEEESGLTERLDRIDALSEEIRNVGLQIANGPACTLPGLLAKVDICVGDVGAQYDPSEYGLHEALGALVASLESATGLKATAPARCKLYAEA